MPDLRTLPALAGRQAIASPHVTLSALAEGTILQVVVGPNAAGNMADLEQFAVENGLTPLKLPPNQWLLVGDFSTAHPDMRRLLAALEPYASGIDQSHGRVRLRLEGPSAATVLSKGTAVDLDPSLFPSGRSAATLIGHISVCLTRLDAQAFEIIVLRGFAGSLWDDLAEMCAEHT